MAYDPNNLSALAYANGFTIWHYRTKDKFSEIAGLDYFQRGTAMLRVDDQLTLNAGDANGIGFVSSNDGEHVAINIASMVWR